MSKEDLIIQEVLRYVQMPYHKADKALKEKIMRYYQQLEAIALPRITYKHLGVKKGEDWVSFQGTDFKIKSKDLKELFEHCESCYVLGATLGVEVDRVIQQSQKKDMSDALFFNACANVMIEVLCDEVEQELAESIDKARYMTMRFSPGYGDVPLDVQPKLLQVLEAQKYIGLTLSKSGMLLPLKSVTALIGISNQKENRSKTCKICMMQAHCAYKKRGDVCGH